MLDFFKSKTFKISASLVLVAAFLLSLNSKFDFISSSKNEDNSKTIAEIENLKITERDLELLIKNFKNEILNQDPNNQVLNLAPEDEENLRKNLLNGLINEKLFMKFAEKMKLEIDDEIAIEQIKKTPQFGNDAGMFDQEKFQEFLKMVPISERDYINEVKKNILTYALFNIFNNPQISLLERNEILLQNLIRTKKIDILEMDFEKFFIDFKKSAEIPDSEIKEFYEKNQNLFETPESRKIKFSKIQISDFGHNLQIDEELIKKRIAEKLSSEEFQNSDLRDFDNLICESENDAKKIIDFLSKIKFSEYESKSSKEWAEIFKDQEKLNCLVLDLKEKQKENLPSNFGKIVFEDLKTEDNSFFSKEILESGMGKHVFVLRKTRKISENDIKENVIKEIEKELINQKYSSEIEKIRSKILNFNENLNQINNNEFSEVLKEIGISKSKEKKIFKSENGYFSDQLSFEEIQNSKTEESDDVIFDENLNQNIFSSKENSINLFQINDSEYVFYQTLEANPKKIRNFDEVSEEIKKILTEKKAFSEFKKKSKEISENLASNENKNLDEIFQKNNSWTSLKKDLKFFNPILVKMSQGRIQNPDYPFQLINEIANNKNEKLIGPIEIDEFIFFVFEKEHSLHKISEEEKEKFLKAIEYTTYANESNEIINSVTDSLKKKFKIKKFIDE